MSNINRICRGAQESAARRPMLLSAFLMAIMALSLLAACVTPTPEAVQEPAAVQEHEAVQEMEQVTEAPSAPSPFVCEEFGEELVCKAEQERVTVVVPWQGRKVQVENLPPGTLEELWSDKDEFMADRLVINFEVVDAANYEIINTFDPPMQLEVAYTAEDVAKANELENLVLGFWNDEYWVAFTKEKHDFVLEGDSNGGIGIVKILSWGDKPIAWGDP